ncbi:hypothetical protein HDU96_005541, partial [Phlyctochytrium bullatum]
GPAADHSTDEDVVTSIVDGEKTSATETEANEGPAADHSTDEDVVASETLSHAVDTASDPVDSEEIGSTAATPMKNDDDGPFDSDGVVTEVAASNFNDSAPATPVKAPLPPAVVALKRKNPFDTPPKEKGPKRKKKSLGAVPPVDDEEEGEDGEDVTPENFEIEEPAEQVADEEPDVAVKETISAHAEDTSKGAENEAVVADTGNARGTEADDDAFHDATVPPELAEGDDSFFEDDSGVFHDAETGSPVASKVLAQASAASTPETPAPKKGTSVLGRMRARAQVFNTPPAVVAGSKRKRSLGGAAAAAALEALESMVAVAAEDGVPIGRVERS